MAAFFKKHFAWIGVLMILMIIKSTPSLAQVAEDNILDGIVLKYQNAVRPWRTVLTGYANTLFWLLVTIDFTWNGIQHVLKRSELSDIVYDLMLRVMVIGFYLALLQHSDVWMEAIVESFRKAAAAANNAIGGIPPGYGPSDIFDAGLEIAIRVTESMTFMAPGDSFAIGLSAIVILIIFALIAALILVTLVEMYIALGAGVLLLGFGGSRWTRDIANKMLNYVVSVGAKLFAMQLIIGIGQTFIMSWFAAYQHSWSQLLVLLGTSVVYLVLSFSIPAILQSVVSNVNVASGGQQMVSTLMGAATQGASMAATGTAQAFGGAVAAREAFQLAGMKGGSSIDGPGQGLGAAGLLGGAAFNAIAGKMSGNPMMQGGNVGGRMAADLKEQRIRFASESASTNVPEIRSEDSQNEVAIPREVPKTGKQFPAVWKNKPGDPIPDSLFTGKTDPSLNSSSSGLSGQAASPDLQDLSSEMSGGHFPSFSTPAFLSEDKPAPAAPSEGSWEKIFGAPASNSTDSSRDASSASTLAGAGENSIFAAPASESTTGKTQPMIFDKTEETQPFGAPASNPPGSSRDASSASTLARAGENSIFAAPASESTTGKTQPMIFDKTEETQPSQPNNEVDL